MYAPQDWYWFIGSDTDNVWSSARAMSVPASDANYTAWTAVPGNIAPTLPTMAAVENVLRNSYPPGTPKTYAADVRYRKASGGVIVTSLSSVPFLSDPVSRNTIANALEYIKTTPGSTVNWKMSDGSFIVLNETQLDKAVTAIASFVQSCFTKESEMVAGIDGGSITTLAQIDSAFAAISNVFP